MSRVESLIFEAGEKTHRDENFPVASYLISKKYRAPILAFYRFARAADDVADDVALTESQKVIQLNAFEDTLLGKSDATAEAFPLREEIAKHNLSPRHAQDLLIAFRQDANKQRYKNWDELMNYCAYSAAPVGRFVLDVHGESKNSWPASDALCAALQIINHLQDCKADYQRLKRIYIPQDVMSEYSLTEADLAADAASPALRQVIVMLAKKTKNLMRDSALAPHVKDLRLRVEVTVITSLANQLLELLIKRDPLSERVHLNKMQLVLTMFRAIFSVLFRRRNK